MPGEAVDQAGQRALAEMYGVRQVLRAALAAFALGEALQDFEVTDAEPVPLAELALERRGFSSLSVAATAGVPDAEQGLAASLFQTSFQVGGAVVLAVVTAVIDAAGAGSLSSAPATLSAYRPALVLIAGVAAAGLLVALSGLRSRDPAVADGTRSSPATHRASRSPA